MNVKELITELQKCNPEATVFCYNIEYFDEVDNLDGKGTDDNELNLFDEPNVPVAQAKSIVIY